MSVLVDSKGNSASVEYADLPAVKLAAWSYGINKLFDFLEERERVHLASIADSRICEQQTVAFASAPSLF